MNDTSDPNQAKSGGSAERAAHSDPDEALPDGHCGGRLRQGLMALGVAMAMLLALLSAGCMRPPGRGPGCTPKLDALPASHAFSLIAVVPRTSPEAASWALRELAFLLRFVARAGLELHVIYTEDADDLAEGGGDGGPPQVLSANAPSFPPSRELRMPSAPADPTTLTAKLYCERLAAAEVHGRRMLETESARRSASVTAWVNKTAALLVALADRPIPDTSGTEAGVEIDASASIFTAAEVAEASPRPTILFLGGLTSIRPPARVYRLPACLVALIRSSAAAQVLRAEATWALWMHKAGGSFKPLSANNVPETIAHVLEETGA